MKKILFPVLLLFCCAAFAGAKDASHSIDVKWYGSLKKIMQEKDPGGAVPLERALTGTHIYAVGMIKGAAGEITVIDGKVFLNYGKDGIGNTLTEIKKGEEASLFITATVEKWKSVTIPENMSEGDLRVFILEEARKCGINTRDPFPFMIEGTIKKLVWSVLDGTDPESTRQTRHLFFRKLVGYRAETPAVLIGFYPAELQNELAWPGELWLVHVLFKDDKTTGHVNAFSVEKGAMLQLPAKVQAPFSDSERPASAAPRKGNLP